MNDQATNQLIDIVTTKGAQYRRYTIPKKRGGHRQITTPKDKLKDAQRQILHRILDKLPVSDESYGFVRGRSIYQNAKQHEGAKCVINLDLKDFFPTVQKERIASALTPYVRTPHAIAELVTYDNSLPQGAPTSPSISNLVCLELDKKLRNLAKKNHAKYTRYADDLTFSSKTNKDLHKIIPKAHSIIKRQGFQLNYDKIRVMRQGGRQTVTGLTVNEKVNSPRYYARNLRAKIHQMKKSDGIDPEEEMKVLGYIGFVKGANPEKADKLLKQLWKHTTAT